MTKTIKQHMTNYTITQQGNCSYRISYNYDDDHAVRRIDKIYTSIEEAESYIATNKSMDMAYEVFKDCHRV